MTKELQKREYVPAYSFIKSNSLMRKSMGVRLSYMFFWGMISTYLACRLFTNQPHIDLNALAKTE